MVMVLALLPMVAEQRDVHHLTAGVLTISYGGTFVGNFLSGVLWDATHAPLAAFVPLGRRRDRPDARRNRYAQGVSRMNAFEEQGYLVIPGFKSAKEIRELRARADAIVDAFDPSESISIFTTRDESTKNDDYFLGSAD